MRGITFDWTSQRPKTFGMSVVDFNRYEYLFIDPESEKPCEILI